MKTNSVVLAIVLFVLMIAVAAADDFTFSGDRVSSVFARGRERTLLSGHARIRSDKNVITANEIELFGKDSTFAICRGNVRFINVERGLELTCEELFYDREQKVIRVKGNAIMADRENEVIVKGGFIEHHEETDISVIQIGVRILKEDMVCRAEFATYIREKDQLELTGMPVVYWKGDEYRASKIYIDLNKDEVKLEGSVEGQITSEEEEKKEPEPLAPGKTPPPVEPDKTPPPSEPTPAPIASPESEEGEE
ncbi:MAG: hypothetical protein EHM28_07080 [Spirochaetaceae bacterium]|nr:MAG: hypothetical protein EHM28_07080 [Spirochaetaceae bacterium]